MIAAVGVRCDRQTTWMQEPTLVFIIVPSAADAKSLEPRNERSASCKLGYKAPVVRRIEPAENEKVAASQSRTLHCAASAAEHVVDRDRPPSKEDQGERQSRQGKGEFVAGVIG